MAEDWGTEQASERGRSFVVRLRRCHYFASEERDYLCAPGHQRFTLDSDPDKIGDVFGKIPICLRGLKGGGTAFIDESRIRSAFKKKGDGLRMAEKRRRVENGCAVGAAKIWIDSRIEKLSHAFGVTRDSGTMDLCWLVVLGEPAHPVSRGDHGREREKHRKKDATKAVDEQRAQTAFPPEHGGEKTADQKEERHAESVGRREKYPERFILSAVLHHPRERRKRECRMERDSKQHRSRAERVEVVAAGGHTKLGRG